MSSNDNTYIFWRCHLELLKQAPCFPIVQFLDHCEPGCSAELCLTLCIPCWPPSLLQPGFEAEQKPVADLESALHTETVPELVPEPVPAAQLQLLPVAAAFWQIWVAAWNSDLDLFRLILFWSKPGSGIQFYSYS